MTKYYKVYLIDDSKNSIDDYTTIEQNYAICKETALGFKELITEKDVYPREAGISIPALTFGIIPNALRYHSQSGKHIDVNYGQAMMIGMTAIDVLNWWISMDEKSLTEYVENINRLEELAINKYCGLEHLADNTIVQREERKANKTIKRILKQIKKR